MRYRATPTGYEMEDGMVFKPYVAEPWNGAFTPEMVMLAKAIALSLAKYPERQREAICRHALFGASIGIGWAPTSLSQPGDAL